jgi:carboxylesterase
MTHDLGILILHGFTSSHDTVRALVPIADRLTLPYRMPWLRGHGTRPEDLRGVRWRDWYADAHESFNELRRECRQVILCGHSLGGLVALHLAAERPHDAAGVVSIATALRIANPFARFMPLLASLRLMQRSDLARGFSDKALAIHNTNYPAFPFDAAVSLHQYARVVERRLADVRAPLLVLHSRRDRTVRPVAAETIYARAGAADKHIRWFDQSGHQMLMDCEADAVLAVIETWLTRLQGQATAAAIDGHAHGASRSGTQ